MRLTRILPIILLLTSCAPAAPVAPSPTTVPPTGTSAPTTEPTSTLSPTSTSTPEPTATLTATPFPIPEGAVKTADGATVFVKEGRLWQLDVQGQPAEKNILDVTFENVIDSGIIVRQLHPEYYEDDQKLLKDTLLPNNVPINKHYKIYVDNFAVESPTKEDPGIYDVCAIGYMLNVSRVKWGDKSVAVMNFALVGADQPIPVVLGVMEDNSRVTSFISRIYSARVGTDFRGVKGWGKQPKEVPSSSLQSFADSYLGSIVEMDLLGYADPEEADEFYGYDYIKKSSDYSKIINDSASHQMANTGWLIQQEGFKTSGEFLNRVIADSAKDSEKLGPGFVINNDLIIVYRDK